MAEWSQKSSGCPDLNRGPRRPERRALPGCATPRGGIRYRNDEGSLSRPRRGRLRPRPGFARRGETADAGPPFPRRHLRATALDDPGIYAHGLVLVPHWAEPWRPWNLQLLLQPQPGHRAPGERDQTGWSEDFVAFAEKLVDHVGQIADVCLLALELEPDLGLLCVDFMSSDIAGHLAWHRLDPTHPAHSPEDAGDELIQVYEAIDRACGELVEQARWLWGEEPTVMILSDHGMKPTHWVFRANRWLEQAGYLRYRAGSATPAADATEVDERFLLTRRRQPQAEEPPFAEIDFASTKAYCFGYGGQIYLGELTRAAEDTGFARELADALSSIRHPETDAPAFEVRTKEELYRGAFYEKAPELVLLPFDERVHVESSHQQWPAVFERHERLLVRGSGHFSGQHARTGILAAAGPGIRTADMPEGADITRLPATLLALLGVAADLDGAPLDEILDPVITSERVPVAVATRAPIQRPVYSMEEEARMIERLRDLGYE